MTTNADGTFAGSIIVPPTYPDPTFQDVNTLPMGYAYGEGNAQLDREPPTAAVLSTSTGTNKSLVLNWTAAKDQGASGLDRYELFDNGSAVYAPIPTNVLTYSHTDTVGTAHSFVLYAFDARGNRSVSNTLAFTTS